MITYNLKEIIESQYNRPDEKKHQRSILFVVENPKTAEKSIYEIDRMGKHTASLRCNASRCNARLSIEHNIATEGTGKYHRRCIASTVTKAELMDPTNWMKTFHSHSKRCTITGSTFCDKTEHSCQSKSEGQIIKRKYRSFCIKEKVQKPHLSCSQVIIDADDKLELKMDKKSKMEKDPEWKSYHCGIDDQQEIKAMRRANLVSNGATRFDPKFDQKIENRFRTIPRMGEPAEQFVWEEENFIYFGLARDLMLIHGCTVSMDGTFDDSSALKVKKKKIWSQLYIITKLHTNDKGDRNFAEPVGFALMKKREAEDYRNLFQFLKKMFKQQFPNYGDFLPRKVKTDFEAAAIRALVDEFPDIKLDLCSFHQVKNYKEKLISVYGGKFKENNDINIVWCYLRAVPYLNWTLSRRLVDEFMKILENTLPQDDRRFEVTRYLKETYFDIDGKFRRFSYYNWNHFDAILSGEFNTTTNSSESINSAYNRFCKNGFRSTNIVAENIREFKKKMLNKRGLIRQYGEKKMSKIRSKTLQRQAQIRQIIRAISHMTLEEEIAALPQLLKDLGFANTSEFTLEQIPDDYLYLCDIFE